MLKQNLVESTQRDLLLHLEEDFVNKYQWWPLTLSKFWILALLCTWLWHSRTIGHFHDVYVNSFQQTHQDGPSLQPRRCWSAAAELQNWIFSPKISLHLKNKQTDKQKNIVAVDWSVCGFYLNDRVFQVSSLLQQRGAALPVLLHGLKLRLQISPALWLSRALAQTSADLQRLGVGVRELTECVFNTLGKGGGREKLVSLKLRNLMNTKSFRLTVINWSSALGSK